MNRELQPNSGGVMMTLSQTADALGVSVTRLKTLIGRNICPPWHWPDLYGEPLFEKRYLDDWRDILDIDGLCGE
jgi:hypothetical protein